MNKGTKIGIGILVLAGLLVVAQIFIDPQPSVTIAQWLCGDTYMVEPDAVKAAQGILSDAACGFDHDMGAGALFIALMLGGIGMILFNQKKK